MKPGCIDENTLTVSITGYSENAMSGCLGFTRSNTNFLPKQMIQEGRLANIGPADNRRITATYLSSLFLPQLSSPSSVKIFLAASCSALRLLLPRPC